MTSEDYEVNEVREARAKGLGDAELIAWALLEVAEALGAIGLAIDNASASIDDAGKRIAAR